MYEFENYLTLTYRKEAADRYPGLLGARHLGSQQGTRVEYF
jgi:hypothetical protein